MHTHDELVFAALNVPNQIIALLDTGASFSIIDFALGHDIVEIPEVRVESVHGTRTLSCGIQHDIWGPMYLDRLRYVFYLREAFSGHLPSTVTFTVMAQWKCNTKIPEYNNHSFGGIMYCV